MQQKYYFICNPASRSGRGIEVWHTVEAYLKENAIPYEINFSKKAGNVSQLVQSICEEHIDDAEPVNVIIMGGDGTMDEAIQGIVDFNKINIGYIPTGSGNDFARYCDFGDDAIYNLKNILAVKEPKIWDLGKLEYLDKCTDADKIVAEDIPSTRWFDVSCGIGFDAGICAYALESKSKKFLNKLGLGHLIYVLVALKLIFSDVQPSGTLILDGEDEIKIKKFRFVVGMNTCYEGGGYKFAPAAVPDDGYLDICQVSDINPIQALMIIPKASKGTHVTSKHVHLYHAKNFEFKAEEPLWVHTDGEVFRKSAHIKVSVVPGKLRFLAL